MSTVETQGWEAGGDREGRIDAIRNARKKELRKRDRLSLPTLLEDFREDQAVSREELRDLLSHDYVQPVVSLYLDLDPPEVVGDPHARQRLMNSMRHEELKARRDIVEKLTPIRRARLEHDLEDLEQLVGSPEPQGSRALVAFKSGRELNRALGLRLRIEDRLVIDVDPYVAPLEVLLEARPSALVAEIARDESRLSVSHLGDLRRLREVRYEIPLEHIRTAAENMRQRHRLTHVHWHFKTTVQALVRLQASLGIEHLILSGDQVVLADFRAFLPNALARTVIGSINPSPGADRAEWIGEIDRLLHEHRRGEEAKELDLLGYYQGHDLLVQGLAATLEVINRFLVRYLFLSARLRQPGHVCRRHHFLSLDPGRCPWDGDDLLATRNLTDELVEFALEHGVELLVVTELSDRLEPHGGVAAVTYDLNPTV